MLADCRSPGRQCSARWSIAAPARSEQHRYGVDRMWRVKLIDHWDQAEAAFVRFSISTLIRPPPDFRPAAPAPQAV